jgi:hypothetical protein
MASSSGSATAPAAPSTADTPTAPPATATASANATPAEATATTSGPAPPPHKHDPARTLWVGDLPPLANRVWLGAQVEAGVAAALGEGPARELVSSRVVKNGATGLAVGYGFVEFASPGAAAAVLDALAGAPMPGGVGVFRLNWASGGGGGSGSSSSDGAGTTALGGWGFCVCVCRSRGRGACPSAPPPPSSAPNSERPTRCAGGPETHLGRRLAT